MNAPPELDDYAQTMLMFELQQRNIPLSDIDYLIVEYYKDKTDNKIKRHIKIYRKDGSNNKNKERKR